MLRPALVCLALCVLSPAWATDCPQHYAGGAPPVIVKASLQARTQELCFEAYATMHSGVSRTPLWSAEHLLRANVEAAEQLPRRDSFHPEVGLLLSDRAELSDYARSGYDRGHMAPNGDMPDSTAQGESFSLANMVPQVHANNAGIWAGIEGAVRQLAIREGEVYVVSGPAFIGEQVSSLNGRVLIPTHLWKVVYSPRHEHAGAYLVTNDETRTYSALSVSELERLIGIEPLPGVSQQVRDSLMALPVPRGKGSGHARKKGARGAPAAQTDEYTLSDFARRTIELLLRRLTH